jgi:hypothetical protein
MLARFRALKAAIRLAEWLADSILRGLEVAGGKRFAPGRLVALAQPRRFGQRRGLT